MAGKTTTLSKILLDDSVVAFPAIHTFGCAEVVIAVQLDSGKFLRDIYQLIYRYRLTRPEIDRFQNLRIHDQIDALKAVVNMHKATRLISGTPYLDFVVARNLRLDHLPADRSWG